MTDLTVQDLISSKEVKTYRLQTDQQAECEYAPIYFNTLMPGERLTFPLYLKGLDKGNHNVKFKLILKAGDIVESQLIVRLKGLGIDRLYFALSDLSHSIAYLNNHLLVLQNQTGDITPEALHVFKEHLGLSLRRSFQTPHLGKGILLAQNQVENLITMLQRAPSAMKLIWKVLYRDYSLYNHSVNICMLGVGLFLFLKKPPDQARAMGLAGLLHDVGMTRISQGILTKAGPLSPQEWSEVKNHPWLSYQIMRGQAALACLPLEPLRVALEHHENADGSGYPQSLPLSRQHPWSRVIRLLDTYESLTVNRPYREAQAPFAALKIIQDSQGPRGPLYDLETLKSFIAFLSLA